MWDLEGVVERGDLLDAVHLEGPRRAVDRTAADDVPTVPAEQQLVRRELRLNDVSVEDAAVLDANVAAMSGSIHERLIGGLGFFRLIDRVQLDLHRVRDLAKLPLHVLGQAIFQLGRCPGERKE